MASEPMVDQTAAVANEPRVRLLAVDDEAPVRRLLKRLIEPQGYRVDVAESADQARSALAEKEYALALCDIRMPGRSGIELIEEIHRQYPETGILMVTGVDDPQTARKALDIGVYGYLIKPFERSELLINVDNALRRRRLELESKRKMAWLEEKVRERTKDLRSALDRLSRAYQHLEEASLYTIQRLARAGEYKDEDTGDHVLRMSRYAEALARRVNLPDKTIQAILYAAPMHDIGKIGIPDHILLKPGQLDPDEWQVMKTHTTIGADILAGPEKNFLRLARVIALTHHERWDGKGYPRALIGRQIPVAGQITAVADVFDALTTKRPYKPAWSFEDACTFFKEDRGRRFNPDLVRAFLDIMPEIRDIRDQYTIGRHNLDTIAYQSAALKDRIE
jgi:putative two-component system response regulator